MKGYYMTFRCRLCGKTFTNGGTGDKEMAWTATANAIFAASGIGPLKELENQPLVHETHCCEDGSFGVADLKRQVPMEQFVCVQDGNRVQATEKPRAEPRKPASLVR